MSRRMVAVAVGAILFASAPASASVPPLIEGRAAVIVNARTGAVLYELRGDEASAPASLAKMATALVIAERLRPTDQVKISKAAASAYEDAILWPEGHTFTVDVVLHGMLMESSNGAAIALAERAAGSVEEFMRLVAGKLGALGAAKTTLKNPHGLDAPGQTSTAKDLALVARAFMDVPWLASVSGTLSYPVLRWPPRDETRTFRNRNEFVRTYRGAVGLKNGYTSKAGNSLAAAAVRADASVIVVVLNDRKVYADAATLMDYGFTLVTPAAAAPPPATSAPAASPAAAATQPAGAAPAEPNLPQTEQLDRRATPTVEAEAPGEKAAASGGMPFGRLFFLGIVGAYGARFMQIRSRKRRRARARSAAARAEAMRPAYIPMQTRPQRPASVRSRSGASLRVASDRDRRSRSRAL